ncbi:TetR/AcrR family transcriptional regulator [Arthrobacter sp. TMN-50]
MAVGLADAGGLESLSMRKLAQELGVEAMSLYYHVKSKDDLIDGMVDVVFSEIVLPSPKTDWKSAMRERAESARAVLARHSWAIALMRSTPGAETLKHLDATIGCLRGAGFSPAMAGHAMSLLDSYVDGFALQEASLPLDESGGMSEATEDILAQQRMMSDAYPHLAEIAVTYILQPEYAFGNEFRFGLQIILEGIEAAHASEES